MKTSLIFVTLIASVTAFADPHKYTHLSDTFPEELTHPQKGTDVEVSVGPSIGTSHPRGGFSLRMRIEKFDTQADISARINHGIELNTGGESTGKILEGSLVVAPLEEGSAMIPQANVRLTSRKNYKAFWVFDGKSRLDLVYDRDVSLNRKARGELAYALMLGTSQPVHEWPFYRAFVGLKGKAGYDVPQVTGDKPVGFALIGPTGEMFICSERFENADIDSGGIDPFYSINEHRGRVCASLEANAYLGASVQHAFEGAADVSGSAYYEREIGGKTSERTLSIGPQVKAETVCGRGNGCDGSASVYLNVTFR